MVRYSETNPTTCYDTVCRQIIVGLRDEMSLDIEPCFDTLHIIILFVNC